MGEGPPCGDGEQMQAAQPLNVTGAFHQSFLYYPYRLKRVLVADGVELTRYETQMLRSDGVSLSFGYKAALRGTPGEDRVLALGDGTELSRPPHTLAVVQSGGHHAL